MARLRGTIVMLLAATAACAIAFGDVLTNVIAAFNSLTVFLPAAFGALMLRSPPILAARVSMSAGLIAAVVLTPFARDMAAILGFATAAVSYAACWWWARG